MDRGYVKNWRKIKDEPWYTQPLTAHLAQHLIREANHKDKQVLWNGRLITVKRGQLITGRDRLSRDTGLSQQNIRTSLEILKKCEFLTIKSTNKFSIITICNYGKYQDKDIESNQQSNQQSTSSQPAANHNQECIKNGKKRESALTRSRKISSAKETAEEKRLFGKNVWLTSSEHDKLIAKFGAKRTADLIEDLDYGIGSKGYKYRNHYMTILKWDKRDRNKNGTSQSEVKDDTQARKLKAKAEYDYFKSQGKSAEQLSEIKASICKKLKIEDFE